MNRIQINGLTIETNGPASVLVTDGKVYVDGRQVSTIDTASNKVIIKGNINELKAYGNVEVNGNVGEIDAGGNVVCRDVSGSIDAGGNVSARNVKHNIDAGGNVTVNK